MADSGPGTLRQGAESSQPLRIGFRVSGVISLGSPLDVGSNKTIDGAGADVTISNQGLLLSEVSNVIIRNLSFRNGQGATTDAIGVRNESHDIWVDHCDFATYADGLVDVTRGGTDVTISWSKFSNHNKTMLLNGEVANHVVAYAPHVTVHHNLFDGTYQRNPLVRHGLFHVFNNYLRNWGGYGMHATENGQLFSEANIFEAGSNNRALLTRAGKNDYAPGMAVSKGDWVVSAGSLIEVRLGSSVFDPSAYYTYVAEPANAALRDRILSGAGVQGAAS